MNAIQTCYSKTAHPADVMILHEGFSRLFVPKTAGGVIFGKIMCKITGGKVNPMIGAAGVSAVPMAARVVNKIGLQEDPQNFLLMHAMKQGAAPKLTANPYSGSGKPLILAVYHPYPNFSTTVESAIRPLPGYSGWVDSRMERDMQRMRGVGINGVLLSINPEDLADNIRFERISGARPTSVYSRH